MCLCVCAGKVWSLPAVSNEVQSLICPAFLQLPSLDPLCCCTPCPVGAQFAGLPGPCWVLAESKAEYLLLWDRIQNLLPFLCHRSLTKPTSEAAGGSAALPPTSSPSWGAGGSPPALWPLCCMSRLAAAAWCEADVPCLVLCLASVHPAGICIPVLAGKVSWALWKRPRYPPRGRVSSRAENTWQRSAERKGMPFASSFSVLPGFSRFPERKNCIFLFFNQCLEAMLGSFF